MGEAINLVNNFKVEKVIFNCGEFNNLESKLIKVLDKKPTSRADLFSLLPLNKAILTNNQCASTTEFT